MKKSKAAKHLTQYMQTFQKYRSTSLGEVGLSEEVAGEVWPWVFGEKCSLPILAKIIGNYEADGSLTPLDYYNQMYILYRFMPGVLAACMLTHDGFPADAPGIIVNWEKE